MKTLHEQYGEDTRFIVQIAKSEQMRIANHIRYELKKNGCYTADAMADAMSGRVCDVFE